MYTHTHTPIMVRDSQKKEKPKTICSITKEEKNQWRKRKMKRGKRTPEEEDEEPRRRRK